MTTLRHVPLTLSLLVAAPCGCSDGTNSRMDVTSSADDTAPDTTASEPDTTSPNADTTASEPDTTSPEPDTTSPEPDTSSPGPDTAAPPEPTALPYPTRDGYELKGLQPDFWPDKDDVAGNLAGGVAVNLGWWLWEPTPEAPPCAPTSTEYMGRCYRVDAAVVEQTWRLRRDQAPGTRLLFACRVGDHNLLTPDPGCEGLRPLGPVGWILDAAEDGAVAPYRCYVPGAGDHFISPSPDCEGQTTEALLGWAYP